jgi:hypothetical protein
MPRTTTKKNEKISIDPSLTNREHEYVLIGKKRNAKLDYNIFDEVLNTLKSLDLLK